YADIFAGIDAGLPRADFAGAQKLILERAEEVKDARWESGEINTRKELIRRLTDARAVFGTGEYVKGGKSSEYEWRQKQEVEKPAIMQYLERGFVRHDALNTDPRTLKHVFNSEFIQAMMQHGFYPGAAWNAVD